MTTIHAILDELAQFATDHRDKGDKFGRLMVSYFKTDSVYLANFSDVWRWDDWPGRGGRPDTGIDLVAKECDTGDYCAIQCKVFAKSHDLQRQGIDSFFTACGKAPFTSRISISIPTCRAAMRKTRSVNTTFRLSVYVCRLWTRARSTRVSSAWFALLTSRSNLKRACHFIRKQRLRRSGPVSHRLTVVS